MKTLSALILLVLICFHSVQGQLPDNMSFEQNRAGAPLPFPWFKWGNNEYRLIQDSTTAIHGKYSLRIERTPAHRPTRPSAVSPRPFSPDIKEKPSRSKPG